MSTIIKKDDFSYSFDTSKCQECGGRCCTGESGYIYVVKSEILKITQLLELNAEYFIDKYLFKHNGRYSLKEIKVKDSYDCTFYDRTINRCSIYEARPTQCKTFPFWNYFKKRVDVLKLECPGIIDD